MSQVKVLERLASTRESSKTPSPSSSRPSSTSRESEPSPNQETSLRSAVQTLPQLISHQQQSQQQQSLKQQQQLQSQHPVQQSQQLHHQQQLQQPLPHSNLPRLSLLPRQTSTTGETLPEETLSQASKEDISHAQNDISPAIEEGGSAACVLS